MQIKNIPVIKEQKDEERKHPSLTPEESRKLRHISLSCVFSTSQCFQRTARFFLTSPSYCLSLRTEVLPYPFPSQSRGWPSFALLSLTSFIFQYFHCHISLILHITIALNFPALEKLLLLFCKQSVLNPPHKHQSLSFSE